MATAEVVASSNGDMTPLIILSIIKYKYRYQYPKAGAQLSLVMYAFVCETALAAMGRDSVSTCISVNNLIKRLVFGLSSASTID